MRTIYSIIFLLSGLIILGFDFYYPIIGTVLIIASNLFILNYIIKTNSKPDIVYNVFVMTVNIAITKASIGYYSSGYIINQVLGYKMDHELFMLVLIGVVFLVVVVLKVKR